MSRLIPVLSLGCLAAISFTVYGMLYGGETERIGIPNDNESATGSPIDPPEQDEFAATLDTARRSGSTTKLTEVIGRLQQRVARRPEDRDSWRCLAEAFLQRVVQRGHLIGMRPGRPVYEQLPGEITADLDAAAQAVQRARELGDDSGELFLISAEIMSQRITGLATALQWNGRIEEAIAKASERIEDDPRLHLVLGLRKLLAPEFLGHDPDKALEHFRFAAEASPGDERPAVFAAMASHLKKKRLQAIAWLERAVERNPNNVFARVVLERVRRGEEDPFGRDVTASEATSGR